MFNEKTLLNKSFLKEVQKPVEETLKAFNRLSVFILCGSFTLCGMLLGYPLYKETQRLEQYQHTLQTKVASYQAYDPTIKIPGSMMLIEVLEHCKIVFEEHGLIVKTLNIEKVASHSENRTALGYALVRMHLTQGDQFPKALHKVEELEPYRVTFEEVKMVGSENRILLKVYFDPED